MAAAKKSVKGNKTAHVLNLLTAPGEAAPAPAEGDAEAPAQEAAQPACPPPCRLPPLPGGRACARRSPARARATCPPAGHLLLPRTPSMPRTKPRSCPAPLSLSLALLFSPCSLFLSPENHRRRRRASP